MRRDAKLLHPINVEVTTVEQAWLMWHFLNHPNEVVSGKYAAAKPELLGSLDRNNMTFPTSEGFLAISKALTAVSIDPHKPLPAPITIGNHTVTVKPDGIQVGCQFVPKDTVRILAKELGLL